MLNRKAMQRACRTERQVNAKSRRDNSQITIPLRTSARKLCGTLRLKYFFSDLSEWTQR